MFKRSLCLALSLGAFTHAIAPLFATDTTATTTVYCQETAWKQGAADAARAPRPTQPSVTGTPASGLSPSINQAIQATVQHAVTQAIASSIGSCQCPTTLNGNVKINVTGNGPTRIGNPSSTVWINGGQNYIDGAVMVNSTPGAGTTAIGNTSDGQNIKGNPANINVDANVCATNIGTGTTTGAVEIATGSGNKIVRIGNNNSDTIITLSGSTYINDDVTANTYINATTGNAGSVLIGNQNASTVNILGEHVYVNDNTNGDTHISALNGSGSIEIGNPNTHIVKIEGPTTINAPASADTKINTDGSTGAITIGGSGNMTTLGSTITVVTSLAGSQTRVVQASDAGQLLAPMQATSLDTANTIVTRDSDKHFETQSITLGAMPSSASDAANKNYVDAVAQGLKIKQVCQALGYDNIPEYPLSGLKTIDGVPLTDGDRVLLIGQNNTPPGQAVQNGFWEVHPGDWTRPYDFPSGSQAESAFSFIIGGNLYRNTGWVCTSQSPWDYVDTNSLIFTEFSVRGVAGPLNTTRYAVARWADETGLTLDNSTVLIHDSGNMSIAGSLDINRTSTISNTGTHINTGTSTGNVHIADGTGGNSVYIGNNVGDCYLGIVGKTVGNAALPVLIDQTGKVGVAPSSMRYKEHIKTIDTESSNILKLRPVKFNYKNHAVQSVQYGLIAEEVAHVSPELVIYKNGEPEAVQYQQLPALLIHQLQVQHKTIDELRKEIEELKNELRQNKIMVNHAS